ncbi:MAG: hypothetical protein VX498_11620 [Myxococcota bacterium]|nr:hypothetical protein [Myxococcota bacterium]
MRPTTSFLSLLLPVLLLAACSDYHLQSASPTEGPVQGQAFEPRSPSGMGSSSPPNGQPGGTGGSSSPWGSMTPGEFPDEYFAVAWNDPREGCWNCYVPAPYMIPRYDIVDALGRVAVSFDLPWPAYVATHRSLQPAGPGRFLAVTEVFQWDDPLYWKAWFGDGVNGGVERVLEWGWGNTVSLPAAGREITLPDMLGDARVLQDPMDPDRVYVLAQNTSMYANPLLGTLYSIDVRDPEAPVVVWSTEDMIDPSLVPDWGFAPWFPWFAEAFQDGNRTVIVLGLHVQGEDGNFRSVLVDFSPQNGPLGWELDLSALDLNVDPYEQHQIAVRPPLGGQPGRALFHSDNESWCHAPGFASWDGESLVEVESNPDLLCSRLGPMLDPAGEAFMYFGQEPDSEFGVEQRLVISYRGEDVWHYTHFRDGMVDRPLDIHDLVRLDRPLE